MQRRTVVLSRRLTLSALCILGFATIALAADPAPQPAKSIQAQAAESYMQAGRQHMALGDFGGAVDDFTKALQLDPNQPAAKEGLAAARALAEGKPAAARVQENDAIVRTQAEIESLRVSTNHFMEVGEYEGAARGYSQILVLTRQLNGKVDTSKIQAEATQGLAKARERQAAAKKTAAAAPAPAAKPAETKVAAAPAVAAPAVVAPVAAAPAAAAPAVVAPVAAAPAAAPAEEKKIDVNADYEAATKTALEQVDRLKIPQNELLLRDASASRRVKDLTTVDISGGSVQAPGDSEESKLIQAKLLRRVDVTFANEPFDSVINFIRVSGNVNIVVDPAIQPATTPVTIALRDSKLSDLLQWVLQFENLDYCIRYGAIYINTTSSLSGKPCTKLHDIADLTVEVKDFNSSMAKTITPQDNLDEKKDEILGRGLQGEEWADFIRENIARSTWATAEGGVSANTIAYRNGKLVVTHAPEVQEQIRELLNSFRKARAVQVAILARFVNISEDKLDSLGFNWTFDQTSGDSTYSTSIKPDSEVGITPFLGSGPTTFSYDFLDNFHVNVLLTAIRKQRSGNILSAPRLTCFNTQRAYLTVSTSQSFVRTYTGAATPEIGEVKDGITFQVQPFVSADHLYVTLEVIPQVTQLLGLDKFEVQTLSNTNTQVVDPNTGELVNQNLSQQFIQLPKVQQRIVMTTVSVPNGGTLLIGGLASATEAHGTATVPILGSIPIIKHLFEQTTNLDAKSNLIILVTAHVIEQEGS